MTAATSQPLSTNDLAILGAIFDPETSLSRPSKPSQTTSPSRLTTKNIGTSPQVLEAEKSILKTLNTPDPSPTTLTNAISQLTTLVTQNPTTRPSLYTNRAQATRLLPDSLITPPLLTSILSDLHTAINLPGIPPQVLITAHTHRAYILLSASQNPSQLATLTSLNTPELLRLGIPSSTPLTKNKLEDLASKDFAAAGNLGDENARKMSVRTNPYAKMCGAIVKEALREEIRGFYEGRGCGREV